jgi:membrane protein DedA with SNARE-associated domain
VSAGHIVAAVAAVLIAAGVAWRWRRLSTERKVLWLLAALALGVYASGVLSALPDPKEAIGDIAEALGPWTYALVGVMAFLETGAFVGLVAPGETVVIAGGVIAGQGEIDLIPLIGLVWICAVLGDTTSFFIGRRVGRDFLERHGPKVKITHARLQQVDGYFDRHGGKTILIGRFIGLVRALAPFIAGSSGLEYRRFLPFSIVGTGLWATTFCVLGYVFWQSFDRVAHYAGQAVFAFGVVAGVVVGTVVAYRRRREIRDWLLKHERHPLLRPLFAIGRPVYRVAVRPLVAVLAPRLRFLWHRLTPGGLGLELTTCLAAAGIGIYVYVLYLVILAGDPGPTPLDVELLDLGDRIRNSMGVDIAKLISTLGAFPTVATLVAATSILLAANGRFKEMTVILFGGVLVYLTVQATKAGLDRPRPAGPLVDTSDSTYPSGHAAYSTAWIAVALVVTRRLGLFGSAAAIFVAIAIAVAVGLSRIYLRAHYWSDVAGGWGVGVGIFAGLGVIALVVDYIRNNALERAAGPAVPEKQ